MLVNFFTQSHKFIEKCAPSYRYFLYPKIQTFEITELIWGAFNLT